MKGNVLTLKTVATIGKSANGRIPQIFFSNNPITDNAGSTIKSIAKAMMPSSSCD